MKKTLSVLLAFMMLISVLPFSVSASAATEHRLYTSGAATGDEAVPSVIALGDTLDVPVNEGETVYLRFTAEDPCRIDYYSDSSSDTYGYICDADKNVIASNDDGGSGNNFRFYDYVLSKGTYYLGVRYYSSDNSGYIKVVLSGETVNYPDIRLGETKKAELKSDGAKAYFCFEPEENVKADYYSTSDSDTYGYIYDSSFSQLAYNDDGGSGRNFKMRYNFEAGKTYYLAARYYSDGTGEFDIHLDEVIDYYKTLSEKDLSGKYINLAFVVDTTGSMGDEISAVRNSLQEFVDGISSTKATLRIALIDYKDIDPNEEGGPESTVIHYAPSDSIWYDNSEIEQLKSDIGALSVWGGGDTPESAVDALGYLVQDDVMTFNSDAARFCFLLTDAGYKVENRHGIADMDELISLLKEKDIATSVVTTSDYYSTYSDLATQTEGILMDIEGDFSDQMALFALNVINRTEFHETDEANVQVSKVEFAEDLTIPTGKVKTFIPVVYPADATDKGVLFTVENEKIASVLEYTTDGRLVIQGISEGSTKIIARSRDGGYTDSFTLTVSPVSESDGIIESCDIQDIVNHASDEDVKELIYSDDEDIDADEPLAVDAEAQKEIYSALKDTDKTVSFVHSDELGEMDYRWLIKGSDIKEPEISVDFGIKVDDEDSPSRSAADEMLGEFTTVDFSHSGDLPGTTEVTVTSDALSGGGDYDLYYYDPESAELELCDAEVTVDGDKITFTIDHCSSYVVGSVKLDAPSVSGKITSYLDDSDVTVTLTGADFTAEVKGSTEYTFDAVPSGEYTMTVSKANHVTREYNIVVSDSNINKDVAINPLGDVNGDGEITQADSLAAIRQVRLIKDITDEYQRDCADINGDGEITQTDALAILRHVRLIKALY